MSCSLHEVVGILLKELWFTQSGPMTLHSNNTVALYIDSNLVHHKFTKHIDVDSHFIPEKMAKKRDAIRCWSIFA